MLNGKANGVPVGTHDDLGDVWVLALAQGQTFVGRRSGEMMTDDWFVLSPVYAVQVNAAPGPQGGMMIMHNAVPVVLLASITKLRIGPDAIIVPLETLSKHEQNVMRQAIARAEQMVQEMRSSQSGIALVPQMPNLPPIGGGRR
jgi:hypothetical protein